jgi:hypothetical protein
MRLCVCEGESRGTRVTVLRQVREGHRSGTHHFHERCPLLHFNVNIISHETAAMKAVSRISEEPDYLAEEFIQLQSLSCCYEVYVFMHKKIPLESSEFVYKDDRTRRTIVCTRGGIEDPTDGNDGSLSSMADPPIERG